MPALEQFGPAQSDQWNLQQLHGEEVSSDLAEHACHEELVHQCRQQKRHECGRPLGQVESGDGRVVDVTKQEVVHRAVPITGVLVPGCAVPPVAVEASVGETSDFCEDIEYAFLISC